jgi:ankyrin repeat protein
MSILTLVDPCGYLPIHFAIASHNEFLFNLLVEIFATFPTPLFYFNSPDRVGNTPLHWAILRVNYRAAVVLVQFGADISRKNDGGKSPLHLVVSQCTKDCSQTDLISHRKMVKFLITVGSTVDSSDTNNVTPLHIASELGDCAVVESLLLDGGAFVNVIDDVGETPLFYALRGQHAGVVKKLIDCKANLFSRNEDGETPLDYCVSNRVSSMVELLNSFLNESSTSFNSPNSIMSISGISLSGMSISDSSSISLSRTDEIMDIDLSRSQEMNQMKSHADVNAATDNFRRLALF